MAPIPSAKGAADARTPPPRPKRGFITSYGVGRVCAHPACHTALSRYNSSELCYPHAAELNGRRHGDLS